MAIIMAGLLSRTVEGLNTKRRGTREKVVSLIVDALVARPHHEFTRDNFASVVHQCLTRLTTTKKKGTLNFSKSEIRFAVRLVSLVVINLVESHCAQEIYQESIPILSDALVSFRSDPETLSEILNCLAMVGFFGSSYSKETEDVLRVLWEFLMAEESRSSAVTSSAVTAWSFLLTTMRTGNLSKSYWSATGCVSYLLNLLKGKRDDVYHDDDDEEEEEKESLFLAASDALALILQFDLLKKFSDDDQLEKEEIEGKLVSELKHFDDNDDLCKIIQEKFIKRLLGEKGFATHMEKNENFDGKFVFRSSSTSSRSRSSGEKNCNVGNPEREEVVVKLYQPKSGWSGRQSDCYTDLLPFISGKAKKVHKRMTKSPSSPLNKARTQLLNKQRQLAKPSSF